jgi:tRNA (adenine-N(1)-)-methyltransferase non-catalytic subunit
MRPESVLRHLVPLVRGSGHVVVYSSTIEPLTELADLYSRERRGAYIQRREKELQGDDEQDLLNDPDFPLDPTLLSIPTLQTARAVEWQVLPARTHPLMIARGGAEGYMFTATRLLEPETRAVARGKFHHKKRKADSIT